MAESYDTLGYRFAESKFLAKTYTLHSTEHFRPISWPISVPSHSTLDSQSIDETIAELMETLRLHINTVLRQPLPVQKRSRLLRNYWEIEYLVKEVRLLLDSVALGQLNSVFSPSP